MSSLIIISPATGAQMVSASVVAKQERDNLLARTSEVKAVADRIDCDCAIQELRAVKSFLDLIESQREVAKAPALDLGRNIDGLAKELTADLKKEADRISKIIGSYEAAQRAKAEDERRKALGEQARIEAEARQAEYKARRTASSPEEADRKADEIIEKSQAQIIQVQQAAINASPVKTEGARLRGNIVFEVLDIHALYKAHPELCNIEPNGTAIRAILKVNPNLQIPGLSHGIQHKVS